MKAKLPSQGKSSTNFARIVNKFLSKRWKTVVIFADRVSKVDSSDLPEVRCGRTDRRERPVTLREAGRERVASEDFHFCRMAGRPGDPPVAGQERGPEDLGQGHVDGVVGGQVLPQLPGSEEEKVVGIAFAREVREILEGLARSLGSQLAARHESAKHLGDLDIEQMRRVKRGFPSQKGLGQRFPSRRPQKHFDGGGSVEDYDHRP